MAKKDEIKNQQELNELTKEQQKIVVQTLNTIKELEKSSAQMLQYQKQLTEISGDSFSRKEAELKILERYLELEEQSVVQKQEFTEEQQKELDLLEKMVDGVRLKGEASKEAFSRLKKETGDLNKEANRFAKDFFGGIASKIGIASDMSNTFLGRLQKMSLLASQPGGLEEMKTVFSETFTLSKMAYAGMATIIQATIGMVMAADKATAAFAAQTGAGRLLTEEISNVGGEYRNLGLTQEDAGKSATALYNNFPGFMKHTRQVRQELVLLSSSLEKLGVDSQVTGQLLTSFTKGIGATTNEAMRMTQTAALSASSLQMSAGAYMKGLQSSLKVLNL